jgi:hypothetical protein
MPNTQTVSLWGTDVPVTRLCGWGVWKSPDEFDHDATRYLVREQFKLWSGDQAKAILYKKLHVVGAAPYKPGQRSMLWELGRKLLGTDPLNYAQQVGDCHRAGTQVLMGDGTTRNIEDIQVGDYVVTHKSNVRRVLRTIRKPYTGMMYTVKAKGHYAELTSTADHQFVAYDRQSVDRYTWKAISELRRREDSVLVPYGLRHIEYQYVEYDGRRILVDEDFAEIFGWYLANGGISSRKLIDNTVSHQKVTFNLGADESVVASRLIDLLDAVFGVEAVTQHHKESKGSLLVEVYSTAFASFMKTLVPGNVYTKRVPPLFLRSPSAVKMALLRSWIDGDGHMSPKANMAEGCTVSNGMLADFYHLSVSMGLSPNIQYSRQQAHQTCRAGRIAYRGSSGCRVMQADLPNRDIARFSNLGLLRKVKTLVTEDVVDEEVYCLEVDGDSSFIANGYAVHNCVSFGCKNAIEYLQFFPLANGERQQWTMVFPPYLWGMGRLAPDCGNNRLGTEDGSVGAWQARAAMEYGSIPLKYEGVPAYSGKVARQWGNRPGPGKKWIDLGKQHIVKSAAAVLTWEDVVQALVNGYPVTVASNAGFEMLPRADGFHHRAEDWGHQTCLIGVDDDPLDPYVIDLNTWADVHGHLKDFKTGEMLPEGVLRIRKVDIVDMLAEQDSFAYSSSNIFPAQDIDRDKFDLW